ncbi:CBD9-like protein [Mytilinidion resinicola]|uniref:CBD9-like protein n=1 Tax=Mytilinidion resinicola TaxID=574789 RepID=A0A6A6Y618_9PEZI|nr:CBD9-like protein [Mytilinidion resinicola]KAF2803237.1 CBD9-like protein [Mytilinidion resinicola]
MNYFLVHLLVLAAILPWVQCDAPPASTLYLSETNTTFSINLPDNSSDVYIYFSSPAFSWVAVGAGDKMANSLSFIMYPSANNKNVTISPRIASGHSEPTFAPEIQIESLPGTTINNDTLVLNAVCHNCRTWRGGSLDVSSTTQPWIYAFGPDLELQSNSQHAPLRRHHAYGHFTMNMVQASGAGGVPEPSTVMNGAQLVGAEKEDNGNQATVAHAILIAFAILVMTPINVVLVGLFKTFNLHIWFSVLVMMFIIAGFGLGISISGEYNRSKHFSSPHQVLGFITIIAFLAIGVLGGFQSRQLRVPSTNAPRQATKLDTAHTWLARGAWLLAVINGGLGLQFASSPMHTRIIYALVTLALTLPMVIVYLLVWRRQRVTKEKFDEDRDVVLEAYYLSQPKPIH